MVVGGGGTFRMILKNRVATELLLRATSATSTVRAIGEGLPPTVTYVLRVVEHARKLVA